MTKTPRPTRLTRAAWAALPLLCAALALPAHAQSGNSPSRANSKSNAKTSAKPAPKAT